MVRICGFLPHLLYDTNAENRFARKLRGLLWRVCWILVEDFSLLKTVSIKKRFDNIAFSKDVLNVGVMLERTFVINRIWYFSDKVVFFYLEIQPLSPNKYPNNLLDNGINNLMSWTFPDENRTSTISPKWLMTVWSLNPKNHPIEDLPEFAKVRKTLCRCALKLWQTFKGIESTKEIPVHSPRVTRNNSMKGMIVLGIHSTKRL